MIDKIKYNMQKFFNEKLFEIQRGKIEHNRNNQLITIQENANSSSSPKIAKIRYQSKDINVIIMDPENGFFNSLFQILRNGKKGDAVIIWGTKNKVHLVVIELKTTLGVNTFKNALRQIKNTLIGALVILRFLKVDSIEYYGFVFYNEIKVKDNTDPTELDPYLNQHDPVMDEFLKVAYEKLSELQETHKGAGLTIELPERSEIIPIFLYTYKECPVLDAKGAM